MISPNYSLAIPIKEIDKVVVVLLYKHISGEPLEKEEAIALDNWLTGSPDHRALLEELQNEPRGEKEVKDLLRVDEHAAWEKLNKNILGQKNKRLPSTKLIPYFFGLLFTLLTIAAIYAFLSINASKNKSIKANRDSINKTRYYEMHEVR